MTDPTAPDFDGGVAFLDGTLGNTWPEMIDLGLLDLQSACRCVFGQLAAHVPDVVDNAGSAPDFFAWVSGSDALLSEDTAIAYGFQIDHGAHYREGIDAAFAALTRAWTDRIEGLRRERGLTGATDTTLPAPAKEHA